MPYVPSEKTDGKSQDRVEIDKHVKKVVVKMCSKIKEPMDVFDEFYVCMRQVGTTLIDIEHGNNWINKNSVYQQLGNIISTVAEKYAYKGAWLGELNYATTRIIQELPRQIIKKFKLPESNELRYWIYAEFVGYLGALTIFYQAIINTNWIDQGLAGVFEDVKDEYKRRVNTAYEADQIVKSGDCYDTPYYTRLVEIVDQHGLHIGYQEVMLKRHKLTLNKDIIGRIRIDATIY